MSGRCAGALRLVARALCASALLACEDPVGPAIERDSAPPTESARQADAGARHENGGSVDEAGLDAASPPPDASSTAADASGEEGAASGDVGPTPGDAAVTAPRQRAMLVLPAQWVPLDPTEDPFTDQPEDAHCAPAGLMPELLAGESVFSVDTGTCSYVTVRQHTQREIAPDDLVKLRLWHFELSAPEPAEAHAAVTIEGLAVLDQRVPIPQPGGLIGAELRVDRTIPVGTPVYFHLHNHGANSWSLVELSAGP